MNEGHSSSLRSRQVFCVLRLASGSLLDGSLATRDKRSVSMPGDHNVKLAHEYVTH